MIAGTTVPHVFVNKSHPRNFCESRTQYPQQDSHFPTIPREKPQSADERGTFSGTLAAQSGTQTPPADPELAKLLAAWPALPEPIKAGIVALVEASRRK